MKKNQRNYSFLLIPSSPTSHMSTHVSFWRSYLGSLDFRGGRVAFPAHDSNRITWADMFVLCPFYFRSLWKGKSAKREEIKKEIFVEPVNDEFSDEAFPIWNSQVSSHIEGPPEWQDLDSTKSLRVLPLFNLYFCSFICFLI